MTKTGRRNHAFPWLSPADFYQGERGQCSSGWKDMEMIGREVSGSMATIRNLRARSVEGAFAVLVEIKLALWRFRTVK